MDVPAQRAVAIGGILVMAAGIHLAGARIESREAGPSVAVEDFAMPEDEPAPDPAAASEAAPETDNSSTVPSTSPAAASGDAGAAQDAGAGDTLIPEGYAPKLLFQPAATASGRFQAQGYKITLAGVEPVEIGEMCGEGLKNRWPCGATARTQFRNFLRGRALSCVVPERAPFEMIEADCTVGGENASAWLIEQGWARARSDGSFAQASAAAQSAGRGIWGTRPRTP